MKKITSTKDLTPDAKNANAGSQRGAAMVETSIRRYGAGRSIVVDKNGRVIAGNKTLQAVVDAGMDDVIVVPSDGKKLIVHQRTDLDLDDINAKELGIADNQAGAVGLKWDATVLQDLEREGVQVGQFFRDAEWAKILDQDEDEPSLEEIPEMALQPFEEFNYVMVVCRNSQDWQGLCDKLGIRREAVTLGDVRKVGIGRVIDGAKVLLLLQGEKP